MSSDLAEWGQRLSLTLESVLQAMDDQDGLSRRVDEGLDRLSDILAHLTSRKEAASVARAGLEGLLAAFRRRYGESAPTLEDYARFESILREKEAGIASLERDLGLQLGMLDELSGELAAGHARLEGHLAALAEALAAVGDLRRESLGLLETLQAKAAAIKTRYGDEAAPAAAGATRIALPHQALGQLVDQVVASLAPDEPARRELLGQVLASVQDRDIRKAIEEKVADS